MSFRQFAALSLGLLLCACSDNSTTFEEPRIGAATSGLEVETADGTSALTASSLEPIEVHCDSPLSDLRAGLLEITNRDRAMGQLCGETVHDPVSALRWDSRLEAAALQHTVDMITNGVFSHTGTDGSNVSYRVDETGFDWRSVGENLAFGYHNVLTVQAGWIESEGHCSNLMSSSFSLMGAACRIDAEGVPYWTVVFASPG